MVFNVNSAEFKSLPPYHSYLNGVSTFFNKILVNPLNRLLRYPPLIRGTVNDLVISSDMPSYEEPPILEGMAPRLINGLANHIRTEYGERKTPVYIISPHNLAYYGWVEAYSEGRINKGASILHFDSHDDSGKPYHIDEFAPVEDTAAAAELAQKLDITNFIYPAIKQGLSSRMIWVHSRHKGPMQRSDLATAVEHSVCSIDSQDFDLLLESFTDPSQLIVDIDIDYFMPHLEKLQYHIFRDRPDNKTVLDEDLVKLKKTLKKAGVITIATSPGFLKNQEKAIELIKELLKE